MNTPKRLLKEIETPEGKAKIERLVKEYIIKENNTNEKIKELISNKDYLNWLC